MRRKVKKSLKKTFVLEVTPEKGVVFISILAILYFFFNHSVIATSMPLSLVGYKLMYAMGIDTPALLEHAGLAEKITGSTLENPTLILIIGFVVGTVITTLFRGEYKAEGLHGFKNTMMYVIGGFAVGIGAQGIYGANIGEVFGAISMLSLSGWLIIPFICIGIFIGKPVYNKMKSK